MGKYLRVDEQATYIDVTCDGYVLRLDNVQNYSDTFGYIYDPASVGSNEWAKIRGNVTVGGTTYVVGRGGRVVTLLESSPTRVVIRVDTNFKTAGDAVVTNSASLTYWFYCYPDKFAVAFTWTIETSSITHTEYQPFFVDGSGANLTNEADFYDNAGTETACASYTLYNSSNYMAVTSDEINYMYVVLHTDDSGDFQQRSYTGDMIRLKWGGAEFAVGDHVASAMIVLDSADRENDGGTFLDWDTDIDTNSVSVGTICEQSADNLRYICHTAHTAGGGNEPPDTDYWHEYRMTLGNQYKDLVMAAPTTGTEVTDLVIPYDLSSDGFASDGARHLEDSSQEIDTTIDIDRIGHKQVAHNWRISTDGSTERIIEHIKADDNAASSTVVATIGDNANWETLENVNRNTDNDDISSDIKRGTGLDTADTYMIDHVVTAYDNAYFKQGSKHINFTPQFGYDDAADQTIWSLYVDAGDYIQITYDAGNDRYELRVSWGATLTTLNGSAYTESTSLQQLTSITASWDSDVDLLYLMINGQMVDTGTNTGTPSTGNAAYVFTGADCESDADGTGQLPADIYIDEQLAVDGCWLPYGAWFTGNGSLDTDTMHDVITYYWNCSAVTSSDYYRGEGSGAPSVTGATYDTGVHGNGLKCDASGEYGNLGQIIPAATGKFDIGFWYKETGTPNAWGHFLGSGEGEQTNRITLSRNNSDTGWGFSFGDGGGSYSVTTNVFDGNWHYIRLIVDSSLATGERVTILIDGVQEYQGNPGSCVGADETITPSQDLYIGNQYGVTSLHIGGIIDEFTMICGETHVPQIPVILGAGPVYAPIKDVQ